MRNLLFYFLIFIYGVKSFAASGSGNISQMVQFGGPSITSSGSIAGAPPINIAVADLTSVVTLIGATNSATATRYYGFYSANSPVAASKYQVPSGKTLHIMGAYMSVSTAGIAVHFGYANSTFAEGASSVSGDIPYTPTAASVFPYKGIVTVPNYNYLPINMSFPSNSFPYFNADTSSGLYQITMFGVLK